MKKLVIIPTYNEIENISRMIDVVMALDGEFDMLVIDDGSPDGTAAVVRKRQEEFTGRLHIVERSGKLGLGTLVWEDSTCQGATKPVRHSC